MTCSILRSSGIALSIITATICLFAESILGFANSRPGSLFQNIGAFIADNTLRGVFCLGFLINFVLFIVLRCRLGTRFKYSAPWIASFFFIGATQYYFHPPPTSEALILFGTILIGQIVGFLDDGEHVFPRTADNNWSKFLTRLMICMLTLAAFSHTTYVMHFEYRGQERWSGPWDNPNIYGVLMGVGLLLSTNEIADSVEKATNRRKFKCQVAKQFIYFLLYTISAVVCGVGLLRSYSRGAWIATACGAAYLVFTPRYRSLNVGQPPLPQQQPRIVVRGLRQNWKELAVITVSLVLILLWGFRFTQWRPARRMISVANINDFSWRNRVAAWEGALRISAEHPWAGLGWGRTEQVYDNFYNSLQLPETAAIQMNDYLMLCTSIGVPGLICFFFYICAAASKTLEDINFGIPYHTAVCRAGAITLLIGFWFDGGLFRLPTASVFWVLLELGRIQSKQDRRYYYRKKIFADATPLVTTERIKTVYCTWTA